MFKSVHAVAAVVIESAATLENLAAAANALSRVARNQADTFEATMLIEQQAAIDALMAKHGITELPVTGSLRRKLAPPVAN